MGIHPLFLFAWGGHSRAIQDICIRSFGRPLLRPLGEIAIWERLVFPSLTFLLRKLRSEVLENLGLNGCVPVFNWMTQKFPFTLKNRRTREKCEGLGEMAVKPVIWRPALSLCSQMKIRQSIMRRAAPASALTRFAFWIRAAMSNARLRSAKRIESCDCAAVKGY